MESVSHETVSSILRGKHVPSWNKLKSIIVVLCAMSERTIDSRRELVECLTLWNEADLVPPETEPADVLPEPAPTSAIGHETLPLRHRVEARCHGEIPARSSLFTGRKETLDEIERRLIRSPQALLLHGPIGSGKTQIAAEYMRQNRERYTITWWVPAATVEEARLSLLRLADALHIPPADSTRLRLGVLSEVLGRSRPYLLIFDGVVTGDVRTLITTRGGDVIVTARNPGWGQTNPPPSLEIPGFDEGESTQLLRKYDPSITAVEMRRVVTAAGRTPFGLVEACKLHSELGCTWDKLAEWLADPKQRVLTGPGRTATETVRQVLDEGLTSEPGLKALLTLLLGFGSSPVWVWILRKGMDGDISAGARQLLADLAGLQRQIQTLARIGLARRHPDGDWVRIPAFERLVLHELLPESRSEINRRDVVEILVCADPGRPGDRDAQSRHTAIVPHLGPAGILESSRPAAYRTVHHQIRFLFLTGNFLLAQKLGREAEAALARHGSALSGSGIVLLIKRDLANALRADGRYPEADRLTEESLKLALDSAYPGDAEAQAIVLDLARSRGHDLRLAGRYQEAHDRDELTLKEHLAAYDVKDPRCLASGYNLSVSRRFLGRYREAEAADRIIFDRFRDDRRRRARLTNALAEDLYGLGRFEELADLLAPILESESGRELYRARRMAGVALRRLGHSAAAVEQLGACHQACLDQFGSRHELSLTVCLSFANALRDRGQSASALHYCLLAEKGYRDAMGDDNPLVQVARVNTAAVHLADGDRERAAWIIGPAYSALAQQVGVRHPFTVLAGVNQAFAAASRGPEPVWPRPFSAYEQARELFGAEHLDTLLAGAGLAATRAARDEESDLASRLDQILSALRRRFGSGHELVTRVAGGLPVAVDIELPSA
ncbi:FxSxx-COOH system tetratricopeptide repeat protein [Actinoplanes sp. HUAS TT8]|uniref:FxSxx-COOH system tetratricopeptide repeat protein n=1 Tax=Actinoplanes sp. HUAS TT8 TaxID=3447453 RepID=UPI003F52013D